MRGRGETNTVGQDRLADRVVWNSIDFSVAFFPVIDLICVYVYAGVC